MQASAQKTKDSRIVIVVNHGLKLGAALAQDWVQLVGALAVLAVLCGILVFVLLEIQRHRKVEAALRASEARLQSLFAGMAEGVALHEVVYDAKRRVVNYRILAVNSRYETITRLRREAVVGRLATEVYDTPEAPYLAECARVVETGQPSEFETFFPPLNMHVCLSVTPMGPAQFATLFLDITECVRSEQLRREAETTIRAQRDRLEAQNEELTAQNEELITQGRALAEAEARLKHLNSDLEARIDRRTMELHTANAALLRADRLKDEFLANMSHELRTPLTGILGLTEVMDQGIYGPLSERQSHALHLIHSGGEHLLGLINDILDLSKVEAGKMELLLEPVEVEAICHASLGFVLQTAQEKNIQCIFWPDRRVALMMADSRRLKQMLVNLLSNAVKFTPEGGKVGLEVEGNPDLREVRFTVWDTGIGIPPEQQRYLFEPFLQLYGSLAREHEGTGLGLALVHSLVELHGGRVVVESAGVGQGSRFTLTLPWLPEASSETPAGSAPRLSPSQGIASFNQRMGRRPIILAVDDSPVTLTLVTSFLEAVDCQVLTAQDGARALDLTYSAHPDLLLLDIQMPRVDGLVVLQELRAHWAGPPLPVIVLTALAMTGDRERYLAAGADDYLSKPMQLDDLAQAIGRQLERIMGDPGGHSDAAVEHGG